MLAGQEVVLLPLNVGALCSTIQYHRLCTFRRVARNPRVCARFAIAQGPRERPLRRYSPESSRDLRGHAVYAACRSCRAATRPRMDPLIVNDDAYMKARAILLVHLQDRWDGKDLPSGGTSASDRGVN